MAQTPAAFAARVARRIAVAVATAILLSVTLLASSGRPADGIDESACRPPQACHTVGLAEPVPEPTQRRVVAMVRPTAGPTTGVSPAPTLEPTSDATQRPRNVATPQPVAGETVRPRNDATPRPVDPALEPTAEPTKKPGRTLTFAEECTSRLRPEWHSLNGPGDPGYAVDTDFMGDLRQVSVANGRCVITAERTETPSGRPYASGAMTTKGNFAQRYGTFEVRVRYPAGQGFWPAFWLLKQQAAITTPPELDVFEAYPAPPGAGGGSGRSVSVSTFHSAGGIHYFVYDHGSDMTTDFHTHRVTWSPGLLVFWIDGVETGRITQDVPDAAMFPILSLAVGAPVYRADASTPDSAVMEIDYLRVWAR